MNAHTASVTLAAALALVAGPGARAARPPEPDPGTPLPAVAMEGAHAYSASTGGRSLIIEQAGRTRLERYDNGWSPSRFAPALSITKNLAALACLVAHQRGILDIDAPASNTLHEWRGDPRKRAITTRHLLTQTSGLHEGGEILYDKRTADKNRAALAMRAVAPVGARFDYGPSHYEALAELLDRLLKPRGESVLSFLTSGVLRPIEARSDGWRLDRGAHPFLSTGAAFRARDLLHLGELILRRGSYENRAVIAPENLAAALLPTRPNPMYGMSFWVNRNAARRGAREIDVEKALDREPTFRDWAECCLSRSAPPDLVAMIGSFGQRVYVIPSRALVVARQGSGELFRDTLFLRSLFAER